MVEQVGIVRMERVVAVVEKVVVLVFWVKVVGHPAAVGVPEARENCFGVIVRDLLFVPCWV